MKFSILKMQYFWWTEHWHFLVPMRKILISLGLHKKFLENHMNSILTQLAFYREWKNSNLSLFKTGFGSISILKNLAAIKNNW